MIAALLEAPGSDLVIVDDVEIEQPRAGEVLVGVNACSLCHSDLNFADGHRDLPLPAILGHEVAGIVVEVGEGVKALAPGDSVVLTLRPPCRYCYFCVRGEPQLCRELGARGGVFPDGGTRLSHRGRTVNRGLSVAGLAEYVISPATGAVKVPQGTPLELVCILGCGVQTGFGAAVNTARVDIGDTVLVAGLGAVGLAVAAGARLAGASRIIGVDPVASRRVIAGRFGVTDTAAVDPQDLPAFARDLTGGIGVDFGFEVAGSARISECLLDAVRDGGTVVTVGGVHPSEQISISASAFMLSERTIKGCFLGSSDPARDIPRLVDLWIAGRLPLDEFVTAKRPLAEVNLAFEDMRNSTEVRTVLKMPQA